MNNVHDILNDMPKTSSNVVTILTTQLYQKRDGISENSWNSYSVKGFNVV